MKIIPVILMLAVILIVAFSSCKVFKGKKCNDCPTWSHRPLKSNDLQGQFVIFVGLNNHQTNLNSAHVIK